MDFHNKTQCEVNTFAKRIMGLAVPVHWPLLESWLQREICIRGFWSIYCLYHEGMPALTGLTTWPVLSLSEVHPHLPLHSKLSGVRGLRGLLLGLSALFLDWYNESWFEIADTQPQHCSHQFVICTFRDQWRAKPGITEQRLHERSTWLIC